MDNGEREIWRSVANGVLYIKGNDPFQEGSFVDIRIGPGETFAITPRERVTNQRLTVSPELDIFTNGCLEPVQLIEDVPDIAIIEEQPNVKSEAEVKKMLKLSTAKLEKELETITSPLLMRRILDLAEADEELPASRLNAIKKRFDEIQGEEATFIGYEKQTETGDPIFKKKFLS